MSHGNMEANIIDGKKLAGKISSKTKKLMEQYALDDLRMDVFWIGDNKSSESFIKIKRREAEKLGVKFNLIHFKESDKPSENSVGMQISGSDADAVLLQLPVGNGFDKEFLINSINKYQDVDLLKKESFDSFCNLSVKELERAPIPPVAGAIYEIIKEYNLDIPQKRVVIMGNGILVGRPVYELFKKLGSLELSVFDAESDKNLVKNTLMKADLVVSGTGIASLIKPEMLKDGVILIDAGTSSQKNSSALLGDIDEACGQKASLFARTPGGVGPITVAVLYQNLVKLKLLNSNML